MTRLIVSSQAGPERRQFRIGQLWRASDEFAFGYELDRLNEAEQNGFRLPVEFPSKRSIDDPYRAPYLFATFLQRIPSKKRPDYFEILKRWGVYPEEQEDLLRILARSGGVSMGDELELSEYRSDDDNLASPLEFRLAGARYCEASESLSSSTPLVLERESENMSDANAVRVQVIGGDKVGYVPRIYSKIVARLFDNRIPIGVKAVRRLLVPRDRHPWVLEVRLLASQPR